MFNKWDHSQTNELGEASVASWRCFKARTWEEFFFWNGLISLRAFTLGRWRLCFLFFFGTGHFLGVCTLRLEGPGVGSSDGLAWFSRWTNSSSSSTTSMDMSGLSTHLMRLEPLLSLSMYLGSLAGLVTGCDNMLLSNLRKVLEQFLSSVASWGFSSLRWIGCRVWLKVRSFWGRVKIQEERDLKGLVMALNILYGEYGLAFFFANETSCCSTWSRGLFQLRGGSEMIPVGWTSSLVRRLPVLWIGWRAVIVIHTEDQTK